MLHNYTPYKRLQVLGYLLGGILPILFYLFLESMGLATGILDERVIMTFLGISIVGIIIGYVAMLIEHHYTENSKWFQRFFFAQAVYSFFLIHTIVLYTGGVKLSVFSSSYLYMLAAIGSTYGFNRKLTGAAIFFGISFTLNLRLVEEQKFIFDHVMYSPVSVKNIINKSNPHNANWMYIFVYATQCIATLLMYKTQNKAIIIQNTSNKNSTKDVEDGNE